MCFSPVHHCVVDLKIVTFCPMSCVARDQDIFCGVIFDIFCVSPTKLYVYGSMTNFGFMNL